MLRKNHTTKATRLSTQGKTQLFAIPSVTNVDLANSRDAFRQRLMVAGLMLATVFLSQVLTAQEIIESSPVLTTPAISVPTSPLNLHVVISEALLNCLVAREDVQAGEVRDQFEDTPVAGQQLTLAKVRLDLRPSQTEGRMVMILDGDTASSTAGFSPQAIVSSVNHQQFQASKEILFDGYQLATRRAEVFVLHTDQQNTGAVTPLTGSVFGPLAERVVLRVAQQRQPAAEAFARRRVVEKVYPAFNGEVDSQLSNGNKLLKEIVQPRLQTVRLMPERMQVRSTDTHLHFAASVAVPLDVATLPPAPRELVADHGVSIYLHQSLLQGVVERSELAGMTVNQKELFRLMRLVGLSVDEAKLPGLADLDVEIEFAEVDPLTVEIGTDETRVTLRAAFKAAGQETLPPYAVTIHYRMVERGDNWELKTGVLDAKALDGESDGSSMTELAIKKVFEATLPKVTFPRRLPSSIWPAGKTPPAIKSIRSGNGWLVIGVD